MTEPKAGAPPTGATAKNAKTTVRTLVEVGSNLPHGIAGGDGKPRRELVCKPWRGREEREIAKMRAKGRNDPASFASRLLGFMFTTVGPYDFENKTDDEKMAIISSMSAGDVLYMYLLLRYLCIGKEVSIKSSCDHCGRGFTFIADLETLEIRGVDSAQDGNWTYVLSDPFEMRGEKAEALDMMQMPWATMENTIRKSVKGDSESLQVKLDVLIGCILGRHGADHDSVLRIEDLDDMSKRDIERLTAQIEDSHVGPIMQLTDRCPSCGMEFVQNLEWAYDNFFGASSQPSTAKDL